MENLATEIVAEAFDSPGVETDYWPDLERWITESVEGMWIKGEDFGTGTKRAALLNEALRLANLKFEEVNN